MMAKSNLERAFLDVIRALGLDENDPNFKETPARMAKLFNNELCAGLQAGTEKRVAELMGKTFPTRSEDMVVIRDHLCYGLCPHHMLPVAYSVSLAYIPHGNAVGLSKLPRLVDLVVSKPMLQEDAGREIVDCVNTHLSADAMVMMKGHHSCMSIRGVRSRGAQTVTAALSGAFTQPDVKAEFYKLLEV